jgi:hypothetical protein
MISPSDGWAVGWAPDGAANYGEVTLSEHWNGSQWTIVSSPNTNVFYNELWAVSADTSTDVWAVGHIDDPSGNENTLVEHWNGLQWSIIPSPNPVSFEDDLYAVKAFAPNDVWAAGWYWNGVGGTPGYALVIHWNGVGWSTVVAPSPGTFLSRIYAMTATSDSDIWAAGVYQLVSGGTPFAFASHWNGSSWSNYTLPTGPGFASASEIRGILALPSASGVSADVWAVGNTQGYTAGYLDGLCDHWDGTQWSNYPCGGVLAPFYSVSAVTSNFVWAVGGQGSPAIAWWDGYQWNTASTSNVNASVLYGISALGSSLAHAVGYDYNYSLNNAETAAEMYSLP